MEKGITRPNGSKKYIGILLMLTCALLWSANGLCIKLTPWNSMVLAGWRGFAGAITLFIAMKALKMKISINGRTVLIGTCVCATGFLYIIAIIDGCSLAGAYLLMGESEGGNRLSGTLVGLVLMAIVGIPFTFVYPPEVTTISVVMVAVMGIFMLGLPYALYSVAINYCPPLGCVLISSVEIVLNPVWVWLGTGEMPDTFAMIGSAVILVTVTLWCALGGAQAKEIETEIEESKELEG